LDGSSENDLKLDDRDHVIAESSHRSIECLQVCHRTKWKSDLPEKNQFNKTIALCTPHLQWQASLLGYRDGASLCLELAEHTGDSVELLNRMLYLWPFAAQRGVRPYLVLVRAPALAQACEW
jgi:hypothetical protein